MDNLRRDIMRSLRSGTPLPADGNISSTSALNNSYPLENSFTSTASQSYGGNGSGYLSGTDLDILKHEIITGLRSEIRELAREIATGAQSTIPGSSSSQGLVLPPPTADLYQTHLYTQL